MNSKVLKYISVFGLFLAVFPFVVLCEGVGFGEYVWWHYPALLGVYAVFYVCGKICASWALSPKRNRYFRPKAIFLSKAAIVLPILAYVMICAVCRFSSALYIYALPAALIMFHGGHSTVGKEYSDIFSRGWFALFFVAAVVTTIILWFTKNKDILSFGSFQLCFAFGVLIIIAAVLTNQTNIDLCTHQRDSGKTVLPKGLRSYNGGLVAAVVTMIVALCLFTVPLAQGIGYIIKLLLIWIISLIQGTRPDVSTDNIISESDKPGVPIDMNDNAFASILSTLLVIGLVVLTIVFRRQILAFLKGLVAPLFRMNEDVTEGAYVDEVSEISGFSKSERSLRKREQYLYKCFRKETDPVNKYRIGYNLMLLRLMNTPFAPVDTDNTDVHKVKGEQGLHSDSVDCIVKVYNDVRYSGRIPTNEEIIFEESFIEEIRR